MKIDRSEAPFQPVVITLESLDELKDYQLMVKYAFNQCTSDTEMDRITRKHHYAVRDLA